MRISETTGKKRKGETRRNVIIERNSNNNKIRSDREKNLANSKEEKEENRQNGDKKSTNKTKKERGRMN